MIQSKCETLLVLWQFVFTGFSFQHFKHNLRKENIKKIACNVFFKVVIRDVAI